jgi:hypothetical protein
MRELLKKELASERETDEPAASATQGYTTSPAPDAKVATVSTTARNVSFTCTIGGRGQARPKPSGIHWTKVRRLDKTNV